ncbi:MAG: thiol-disulfide isomerase/thioredoxin [Myxococcota bacterium]|jgi:thiol-disulfide isomerase/thioredoxin
MSAEDAALDAEVPTGPAWRRHLGTVLSWGGTLVLVAVVLVVAGRMRAPTLDGSAPGFALTTLDGTRVDLADLRGQTVVVNFWATWCGPCRMEMPMLARWTRAHPDVTVLGVAVDDNIGPVRAFVRDRDLPYAVLWDDAGVQSAYGVRTLPTTVVIGPDGTVAGAHTGIVLGPELDLMLP